MSFTTTTMRKFEGTVAAGEILWRVTETEKGLSLRLESATDRKNFLFSDIRQFIDLVSSLDHLAQKLYVESTQTLRSKVKPGRRGRSKTVDGDNSLADAIMEQVFEVPREDK